MQIDTRERSSAFNVGTPEAQKRKASHFGEQDSMNDEWNDYIGECFTPAFDEKWDEGILNYLL